MSIVNENTEKLLEILEKVQDLPDTLNNVEQATPTISVSSGGLITASATQSAGYVSNGTKSTTKQLTTKGTTTITPSDTEQTAVSAGTYVTGDIKVGASTGSQVAMGTVTVSNKTSDASSKTISIPAGFNPSKAILTLAGLTYVNNTTGEGTALASGKIIFDGSNAKYTYSGSGLYATTTTENLTVTYSDGSWNLQRKNTSYTFLSGTWNWIVAS